MRQRSSDRARMRKLRAEYRKRTAIVGIILLIIGLVLGIIVDRTLFNRKDTTVPGAVPTGAPEPVVSTLEPGFQDDFNGFEGQGSLDGLGTFGDDLQPGGDDGFGFGDEGDLTIPMSVTPTVAATEQPTATPEPTPTVEPTPEPTPTPVPGPTTLAIVPYGESYEFSTQINADGTARINPASEEYETLNFTMTMKDYMLPSDFAEKWGSVYKLQGTEAGAGFELTLNDYVGNATIIPQNIIKIAFVSDEGAPENLGYQLMDAEIAGKLEVELQSNEPKMLWKRYTYSNAGEEMEYLQVSTYKNGQVENILFELESDVAPTPNPVEQYERLTRGDKSDAVRELQERLIELKYLSGKTGKADGNYGSKTQDAVRAAQKDFGMEETGTATPEFQMRLFSDNPLVDEDEAAAEDEAEDEAADEDADEAEDAESVEKSESKKKSKN